MSIYNPNESSLETRLAAVEAVLRSNLLRHGSFGSDGILVYDGGRIIFVSGGGIIIEGDGTIDGSGALNWAGRAFFDGPVEITDTLDVLAATSLKGVVTLLSDLILAAGGKITVGKMKIDPSIGEGAIAFDNGAQVFTDADTIQVYKGNSVVQVSDDYARLQYGGSVISIGEEGVRITGVPDATAGVAVKYLAVQADGRVVKVAGGTGGPTGPWAWPFPLSTVTSEYGPRDGRFHEGIDFGNPPATLGGPIRSFGAGVVEVAGWDADGGFGNRVIVNHGAIDGKTVKSVYGHMNATPAVTAGQAVTSATILGAVGNTGNSFGAHLHAEIHVCPLGGDIVWQTSNPSPGAPRTAVNPRDFMAARGV